MAVRNGRLILFYGGVQLENWINLDNLPKRKDGKIDWKNCNHNLVEFCYDGYKGYFYVEDRISHNNLLLSYGKQTTSITINALIKLQLRKIKRMINIEEHLKQKEICTTEHNSHRHTVLIVLRDIVQI